MAAARARASDAAAAVMAAKGLCSIATFLPRGNGPPVLTVHSPWSLMPGPAPPPAQGVPSAERSVLAGDACRVSGVYIPNGAVEYPEILCEYNNIGRTFHIPAEYVFITPLAAPFRE